MKTKTPKEDPRIKSAREAEERRADASFIENTGELLDDETRRRIRKFGARGGAVRVVAPGVGGGGVTGGAGGSGGSGDPGSYMGGGSAGAGRGSGGSSGRAVLV